MRGLLARGQNLLAGRKDLAPGRPGQITRDGVVQRTVLKPFGKAGQAVPGDAQVCGPLRAVGREDGEIPGRRDRVEGEPTPGARAKARRRFPGYLVTGAGPGTVASLGTVRTGRRGVLGRQGQGSGDHGVGGPQIGVRRVLR